MSKRGWRKLKDEKQRRKVERKASIKRANAPLVGRETGPAGFPLLEVRCPSCEFPTTEVWSLSSGATGCERCAEAEAQPMFAVVHEVRGDHLATHTVTVERASAGSSRSVPVGSPAASA